MKVGDLISFKPKSFGDDDWSNPGIVLESYQHDDRELGGWNDLEVKQDDYNFVTIVQPSDGSRQLYAHPTDVETINESR